MEDPPRAYQLRARPDRCRRAWPAARAHASRALQVYVQIALIPGSLSMLTVDSVVGFELAIGTAHKE